DEKGQQRARRQNSGQNRMKPPVEPRPKQETPAEMVEELMEMIRGQFYQDLPESKWFSDRAFMKKNVVLWPATWLNGRGFTVSPAAYRQTFIDKINDLKRHATGPIKYPTGYLMKCIQDHFRHNEDRLHDEAKAATTAVAAALGKASAAPQIDQVATMA